MEGCETTNFVYGAQIQHTKIHFSYLVNQCLVCDRTSTISYSMFFKAIPDPPSVPKAPGQSQIFTSIFVP